jgi:integrase
LEEIFDPVWLAGYQWHLLSRGLMRNTVSFYMRNLRSIFNKAVARDLTDDRPGLFRQVFTGMEETIKRSLGFEVILRIANAKVSKELAFFRDMFMLSFYLQGMSYVDLAYLKKADFRNGYIVYYRRKSRAKISVKVKPEALRIIRRYAHLAAHTPYLIPIILDLKKDDVVQYQSARHLQNRKLKKLAEELGIDVNLTTYVARHSWATMAYHNGAPMRLISEAMGHNSERTTRIYVRALDPEEVSKANDIVIGALKKGGRKKRRKHKRKGCPSPKR